GLSVLTWTSDILEYASLPADPKPFKLRMDSMFVRFTGKGSSAGGRDPSLVIEAAVQNAAHSFADDAVGKMMPFPGLGIYLSSLQSTLSDSEHGVRLNADPAKYPGYGRIFGNVSGLGYSAKNIYSRQNLEIPTPENRISLRWTVRKMETTNNPPPHISKDL